MNILSTVWDILVLFILEQHRLSPPNKWLFCQHPCVFPKFWQSYMLPPPPLIYNWTIVSNIWLLLKTLHQTLECLNINIDKRSLCEQVKGCQTCLWKTDCCLCHKQSNVSHAMHILKTHIIPAFLGGGECKGQPIERKFPFKTLY